MATYDDPRPCIKLVLPSITIISFSHKAAVGRVGLCNFGENCDNNSRRENDEPDKGSGQTNAEIWRAVLLQGGPTTAHQNVWLMHDGAPTHFPIAVPPTYMLRIQRGGLDVAGMSCLTSTLPDLNPLDFFFWGHLKSLLYETPVASVEDLAARDVVSADIA
ncbi:uncharacterized protein TNCV_4081621 [Trichonephila clavipes]|nr:uncharacterized protein TNCV_4081621 [Trichonephila clavipes]